MSKLKICITTLLIIVLSEAKAQQPSKIQFGFGWSLTSSLKNIEPAVNNNKNEFQVGYRGGAFVRYNFSRRFFGSSGLNFVSDRTKMKNEILPNDQGGPSATLIAKETFSWLEIPIQGNYIFYSSSHAKFFVGGGISIRYLIDAKARVTFTTTSASPSISTIDNYNRMNSLATASLGCQLPLTSSNPLFISLSIDHTMRDITLLLEPIPNNTFTYSTSDGDLRLTTVALNVALILK